MFTTETLIKMGALFVIAATFIIYIVISNMTSNENYANINAKTNDVHVIDKIFHEDRSGKQNKYFQYMTAMDDVAKEKIINKSMGN